MQIFVDWVIQTTWSSCPPVNVRRRAEVLQVACAFVGLKINVAKTKCMRLGAEQAAVVQRAEAQRQ